MTSAEYEELREEYFSTDSIKRREEIEEKIAVAAVALFKRVKKIFDKYEARKELIYDDDYRDDRGWTNLAHEDDGLPMIEKGHLYIHYGDRWAYGGRCSFCILLYTKWFDIEERKKLAEDLRKKRIEKLDAIVENLKKEIDNKQQLLQDYIGEYNTLKAGGDPDMEDDEA